LQRYDQSLLFVVLLSGGQCMIDVGCEL